MRLNLIVSVVLLAVLTSCGGNKSGQATEEVPADSALNDSLRNDSLMAEDYPMPKAADELFDDFVYNFVVNHKLQMERIHFPLPCQKDGKTQKLSQKDWKSEHFFMRQGYYTLLFTVPEGLEVGAFLHAPGLLYVALRQREAHGDCEGHICQPCSGRENPFRYPVDRAVRF